VLSGVIGCADDAECSENEVCFGGSCQPVVTGNLEEACNGLDDDCNGRIDDGADCGQCPYNMVLINDVPGVPQGLCMDAYEASRPDATATTAGENDLYAVTRQGAVPWTNISDTDAADQACRGAAINDRPVNEGGIPGFTPEKRLCSEIELRTACGGTDALPYGGDTVIPGTCNDASVGSSLATAGSFPGCCTDDGICDLAGNAGEIVASPGQGVFGGTTSDAEVRCSFSAGVAEVPSPSVGFRCCTHPVQ